jgi:predicted ATPase
MLKVGRFETFNMIANREGSRTMFKALTITNWRQFERLQITFHDQLTVITGANGAGKTTILNLLSRHFGWSFQFTSTPRRNTKGELQYSPDYWAWLDNLDPPKDHATIGSITYKDGETSSITVPPKVSNQYQINIPKQRAVPGLHIVSHRPVHSYQPITEIPTQPRTRQQVFEEYVGELRNRYFFQAQQPNKRRSPYAAIKASLIALATFGPGNQYVTPNGAAIETFEGYQEVLRQILPPSLGFQRLRVDVPEVVLESTTGNFSMDSVSGGIAALIDLSFQIYMFSAAAPGFVITIDEPENHLHPKMTRSLLPNLVRSFPQCQFIVATHNPFIVGSVPDSNVYVLNYNANQRVESILLDLINKAGSSNDILREVLGVDFTMPIWVEDTLRQLTDKYVGAELTPEAIGALRAELAKLGLEHLFPMAVPRLLKPGGVDEAD